MVWLRASPGLGGGLLTYALMVIHNAERITGVPAGQKTLPICNTKTDDGTLRLMSRGLGTICSFRYAVLQEMSAPNLTFAEVNGTEFRSKVTKKTIKGIDVYTANVGSLPKKQIILIKDYEPACDLTPIDCKGRPEKTLCRALPCTCPFGRTGLRCTTAIFDLKVAFLGHGIISVEWADVTSSGNEVYDIEITTDAAFPSNRTISKVYSPYNISQLNADTAYDIRVVRKAGNDTTYTKTRTAKVLLGIPSAPTDLHLDVENDILRWNGTYRADFYSVCVKDGHCMDVNNTWITTNRLSTDSEYVVQVASVNGVGRSGFTEIRLFKDNVFVILLVAVVGAACLFLVCLAVVPWLIVRKRRKSGAQTKEYRSSGCPVEADTEKPDNGLYEGLTERSAPEPGLYSSLNADQALIAQSPSEYYANVEPQRTSRVQNLVKRFDSDKDNENETQQEKTVSKPSYVQKMVRRFDPETDDKVEISEPAPSQDDVYVNVVDVKRRNKGFFGQMSSRFHGRRPQPVNLVHYRAGAKETGGVSQEEAKCVDVYENLMGPEGSATDSTPEIVMKSTPSVPKKEKSKTKYEPARPFSDDYYNDVEIRPKPELLRSASNEYYANVEYVNM